MWLYDYHALVDWFMNRYPSAYSVHAYGVRYFTQEHYAFIQRAALPLIIFLAGGITFLRWKKSYVKKILGKIIADVMFLYTMIAGSFRDLSPGQKKILTSCFVLLALIKLFLFATLPYHVDEVFNFIYFIDNGPFHSSIFSNNHVLSNIVSAVWRSIGMSPVVSSRVTSIGAGMLVHVFVYATARRFFDFKTALWILLLTGITFWTNVYSVEGGAYMLVTLCWLVSIIALLVYVEHREHGYYLFVITSVLGFYSSKFFVIPFVASLLFWITFAGYTHQLHAAWRRIIFAIGMVLLVTGLLYLPMVLWSGTDAFFLSQSSTHNLISKSPILFEILSVMTNVDAKSYVVVGVVIIFSILYFKRASEKLKIAFTLNACALLSLLLFVAAFQLYPPSRAMVFMNVLFYGVIGAIVAETASTIRLRPQYVTTLWIFVLVIHIFGNAYVYNKGWQRSIRLSWQDKIFYYLLEARVKCIMEREPQLVYFDREDTYEDFYLRLAAKQQHKNVVITYDSARKVESDMAIVEPEIWTTSSGRVVKDDFAIVLSRRGSTFEKLECHGYLIVQ